MIEVEIRSFVSKDQYDQLLKFFKQNAEFLGEEFQETFYFDSPQDLRIQRTNSYSKVWLKKGKIHDDAREEIEVHCARDDFEKLLALFTTLNYAVEIEWYRTRHTFRWNGTTVTVDDTKGYGYIVEFEKLSDESSQHIVLDELKQKFSQLGIPITPKEEFNKKFLWYKKNWKSVLGG